MLVEMVVKLVLNAEDFSRIKILVQNVTDKGSRNSSRNIS